MSDEPIDLDAIEARSAAATPEPWAEPDDQKAQDPDVRRWPLVLQSGRTDIGSFFVYSEADAEFLRYARQDVPDLIREVRRQRAELEALQRDLDAGIGNAELLEAERDRLRSETQRWHQAAAELAIPYPRPDTHLGKIVYAYALARQKIDQLQAELAASRDREGRLRERVGRGDADRGGRADER